MPPTRTSLSSSDQRRGERAPLPPTPPTGRPRRRFLHALSVSVGGSERRSPRPPHRSPVATILSRVLSQCRGERAPLLPDTPHRPPVAAILSRALGQRQGEQAPL